VGYGFTDHVKLSIGAQNLFNRFPNKLNGEILSSYQKNYSNGGVTQYPIFSPFGINGGFYYLKAVYRF
jgi:iron complex outermembrane receptor protein